MYMIYQQYTTAIKNAYSDRQDVVLQVQKAKESREWLESLDIDIELRDALVEPVRSVEEAFKDLLRQSQ